MYQAGVLLTLVGMRTFIAASLLALLATAGFASPATASWASNPNTGTITVCDRSGTCRETPVKFNCRSKKNREDIKVWARLCGGR